MRVAKSKQFKKQYIKLPKKTQQQFAKRLKLYLEDKNHGLLNVHHLKGKYKGLLSFNVNADIRVVLDDSYEEVILLVAIGSHSELYS